MSDFEADARLAVIETVLIDLLSENHQSFLGGAAAAQNAIDRLNCRTCSFPGSCRVSGCHDKQLEREATPPSPQAKP